MNENRQVTQVGIVGICPVLDRSIFETSAGEFWNERLTQLCEWQSALRGQGTSSQRTFIESEIDRIRGELPDLVGFRSGKTAAALERLRDADEVFLYMNTAIGLVRQNYLEMFRPPMLTCGCQVYSHAFSGLISHEGKKRTSQVHDSTDIILAVTAKQKRTNLLAAFLVETEYVRLDREMRLDRLTDIYCVQRDWAYMISENFLVDCLCP